MLKLSDRLETIANLISHNETMADIGTDHGFLPIALLERGICKKTILSDVNRGPLDKARVNAESFLPGASLDLRLGGGLDTIFEGEVDNLVIAGMGGVLMTEILGEDIEKSKSFKKIILQPRNGQSKLRYWLNMNGFSIINEELVREGNYICEIIAVCPVSKSAEGNALSFVDKTDFPEIKYELPEAIFIKNKTLLKEFVEKKINIEKNIIEKIIIGKNSESLLNMNKISCSKERIKFMEKYLEKGHL